jgi:hypothetical protein
MKAIAVLILLALMSVAGLAQSKSLPPIAKDALLNLGKIVMAYDEFTDKSKIEVIIPLQGGITDGVFLFALSTFDGRKVPSDLTGILSILTFSKKASHDGDALIFLIDGERVETKPTYVTAQISETVHYEGMVIPAPLNGKQMRELGAAKQFKGRIGGYLEFEIGVKARSVLSDFAACLESNATLSTSKSCYESGRKVACGN